MKSKSWNSLIKRQPNLPVGIATAVLSLLLLAGIVASAMGQPLLTGQELLSAWQVVQWLAAGVLLLVAGALCFWFVVVVVLPIRDNALSHHWQRRQGRATEQHQAAASPNERPIIYNGPSNALALKSERAKRENLQLLLDSITTGLSQLCYQVAGQQESDAVRAIKVLENGWREMRETMRELDAQLSEVTLEAPQERATASPRGATWQDVLALMEWARERDRIGVRASRDMLRGRGVPIPEQEFGAFSAYVQGLAPLPRPQVSQEQEKQATDSGRTSSLRRTDRAMERSQPRTRKGKR